MARKYIAVIGAGSFGQSLAIELIRNDFKVTMFDINSAEMNYLQSYYEQVECVAVDTTNPNFLSNNGIDAFDYVIVAIGKNVEASLFTVLALHKLQISNIIVRYINDQHKAMLQYLEVELIIQTEFLASEKVLSIINYGDAANLIELDHLNNGVTCIVATKPTSIGKTLLELQLLNQKDYRLIYVVRKNKMLWPADVEKVQLEDSLFIVGKCKAIAELYQKL